MKLVRDNTLNSAVAGGDTVTVRKVANKQEYRQLLIEKVHEEADELTNLLLKPQGWGPSRARVLEEAADLYQAVLAILWECDGYTDKDLQERVKYQLDTKGGFNEQLVLLKIEKKADVAEEG